jgi:hypothetical protein
MFFDLHNNLLPTYYLKQPTCIYIPTNQIGDDAMKRWKYYTEQNRYLYFLTKLLITHWHDPLSRWPTYLPTIASYRLTMN